MLFLENWKKGKDIILVDFIDDIKILVEKNLYEKNAIFLLNNYKKIYKLWAGHYSSKSTLKKIN